MHVKPYLNIIIHNVKPNIERDQSNVPELASKVSKLNKRLEAAAPTQAGGDLKFHSTCFLSWSLPYAPVPLPHLRFPDGAFHKALCIVERGLDGDRQLGKLFLVL